MAERNAAGNKKKAKEEGYLILYADEASVPLNPYISHTYAKRGHPRTIKINSDIHKRIYLASAISIKGELWYCSREKPFDGAAIADFLAYLLEKAYPNEKLLLIWDNTSIHDCETTRRFLATHSQAERLHLVQQPTYSPEVNADEQVWQHLKCVILKNTNTADINQLKTNINQGLELMKSKRELITKFFQHPSVSFYN